MHIVSGIKKSLGALIKSLFGNRSIIIISEKNTNHVSFTGKAQFLLLTAIIGFVGWASYSTGSYMAAKSVIEEKDATIRSVANSRIDTNFRYSNSIMPAEDIAESDSGIKPLTDPTYALAAIDKNKLYARIAFLESKVRDLEQTNDNIIQTVRERTNSEIAFLENIITKTGLKTASLIRNVERQDATQAEGENTENAQGGPFVPVEAKAEHNVLDKTLLTDLDHLNTLYRVIQHIPLSKPILEGRITSTYGRRIDPFTKRPAFHGGIDFVAGENRQIVAANRGKVKRAGRGGAYGNVVDIDHGLGLSTRYGHLSKVLVEEGEYVEVGQPIGIQGSTGRSTGAHLHYEIRYFGKTLNPYPFITAGKHHVSKKS